MKLIITFLSLKRNVNASLQFDMCTVEEKRRASIDKHAN